MNRRYINGYTNYYEHPLCASKRRYRVIVRQCAADKVQFTRNDGSPTRSANLYFENDLAPTHR